MSYEFFQASGSRFRVVLGSDLYDEHWNNFLNHINFTLLYLIIF